MSDDPIVVGRSVVDYWRTMLDKRDDYGPSCDHNNGLAVIAYLDAIHAQLQAETARCDQLTETLQWNRERHAEQLADMREQRNAAYRQLAEATS